MMMLTSFWVANQKEILISSIFALVSIGLLVYLSVFQTKKKTGTKNMVIGLLIILLILFGVTYSLIKDGNLMVEVAIVDTIIVAVYSTISILFLMKKDKSEKIKYTTSMVALLGIVVGLSSVLMLFSIPIFPMAPYLKLELSGLVIFMVLLWYGLKPAIIVSLLTNIIHVVMPSTTAPVIPFLDEMINFIATMVFILPTAMLITLKNRRPNSKLVLITTIIGIVFTTIFMVLFNAYINLPLVYKMQLKLSVVLKIFGLFNVIKWGAVALSINILWQRLYNIKHVVEYN